MKVPLDWLKNYISIQLTPQEIADALTRVGLEVESIDKCIFEIALTPNLAHCASIRGIARELSAITQMPVELPKFSVVEKGSHAIQTKTSVDIENTEACPRYACRVISGIRVSSSPNWLKERIEQCGMRSVNNVVDITNLVLLEFGHPLHAFDFDQLVEKRIIVRNAHKNEKIITLDNREYYPSEDTLLICDAKKPIALAGIMGSAETEVCEATSTILLESAFFDPVYIRKASKRLGIQSEASFRFERGTDPNGVIEALERATALICEITGGSALPGILDIKTQEFSPHSLACRVQRVNQILGTQLAVSEMENMLCRAKLEIIQTKNDLITVQIPTYRHDLKEEIDLIEEIARLYGYDNIQGKQPPLFRMGSLKSSKEYLFAKQVRACLIAEGLQEFLTCDLISPFQASLISVNSIPSRTLIKLINPHSLEQSVMRPSMLPGILRVLKYNADHAIYSLAGFEVGRVHFTVKESYYEPSVLSIVLTGSRSPYHWKTKEEKVDFFDLKGIVENLFAALKLEKYAFSPSHFDNFHPGRQAEITIEHCKLGILGEVHPTTLQAVDLENPVYFAEISLDDLSGFLQQDIKMKPLPQFPTSTRDWTLTVADQISVGDLFHWIGQQKSEFLESFSLLDVYRSDKLGSNRKNVTLRFVYRDRSKTLSLPTVENEHLRITKHITEYLNEESS